MKNLEIHKFVVVSTAHVSEATAKRLDHTPAKDWPCAGGLYAEYGWFVYAHDENSGPARTPFPPISSTS